ncbi:MAG: DUF6624 domain-containing protein [Flavobacteriaceae bacterium]
MKLNHTFLLFLFLTVAYTCKKNTQIDTKLLSIELNTILELDQKYRKEMKSVSSLYGTDSDEWLTLWKKQDRLDSMNLKRISEIIEKVGSYPGKSLVGEPANNVAFFVLQHAPDSIQENYFNMIIDASKNGELAKSLGAKYHDRYLMNKGKPQIYGTQIRFDFKIDSITGEKETVKYLWPISDTTNIDSLRLSCNLEPLEAFLYEFGLSRWGQ